MSLKSFFSILAAIIILGLYIFKYYPDDIYLAIPLLFILGIVGEYFSGRARRSMNDSPLKRSSNVDEVDTEEYHNDFSKVPAGTSSDTSSFFDEHPYDDKVEKAELKAKKKSSLDV